MRSYKSIKKQIESAKNAFQLLQVHKLSTAEELTLARRELAREVHPDVNSAPDAHDLMSKVNAAYAALSGNRDAYVRGLKGKPCEACKGKGATVRQKGFTATVSARCMVCCGAGVLCKS